MHDSTGSGPAPADSAAPAADWQTSASPTGPPSTGAAARDHAARLLRALEREVIPRLAAAHRPRVPAEASNDARGSPISVAEVEAFSETIARTPQHESSMLVQAMLARGVPVEAIYLDLLAPAARLLGGWWVEDRCDFATVTVGLGRLQRLMRELSPAFGTEVAHPQNGRRALLVRAPGEQHLFGLSMVAEFFRRAGWEVAAGGEGAEIDPVQAVRREWYDIVGFSAGCEAKLDELPALIAATRKASHNAGLVVMVGGPAFLSRPQLVRLVGADATAADAGEAPGVAESLLAGRALRH